MAFFAGDVAVELEEVAARFLHSLGDRFLLRIGEDPGYSTERIGGVDGAVEVDHCKRSAGLCAEQKCGMRSLVFGHMELAEVHCHTWPQQLNPFHSHQSAEESSPYTAPVPEQQAQRDYTPWEQAEDWEKHLPKSLEWEVQGMSERKQYSLPGAESEFPPPSSPATVPLGSSNRGVRNEAFHLQNCSILPEEHV